jgi:molybdenum cofactor cytidylyltransferase
LASSNRPRIYISGILLASGASRRINSTKQLLEWQGKYLINHVVNEILKSRINELFVILGDHYDEITNVIDKRPTIVHNPEWIIGKSSSIKMGVISAGRISDGVIFFLVDQPFINKAIINTLINIFQNSTDNIIVPRVNGRLCNPVLFGKKYYGKLMRLSGEQGGKEIIKKAKDVRWVDWEDKKLLLDIDTDEDYKNILKNYPLSSS